MLMGANPRSILNRIVPSFSIPETVNEMSLWKVVLDVLTEPEPRTKLHDVNTLDDVIRLIRASQNIVVLTGAGVRAVIRARYSTVLIF